MGAEDAQPGDLTVDGALARLDDLGARFLWVQYADYNGRTEGKSVPRPRFAGALRGGLSFARANLGFNLTDHQAPGTIFGADSGDFMAVPDPATLAPLPWVAGTARAFAWMRQEDGSPWDGCPRTLLQRQVDAFADRGLRLRAAFEPEAYLFLLGPDGPQPPPADGMFTVAALDRFHETLHETGEWLEAMGVAVEQVAPEYGPGQIEINIGHADPIKAADDLLTLRDTLRACGRRRGWIVSFMPKPFETIAGCGLHVHLSLRHADDADAMAAPAGDGHPSGLSPLGRSFLAGLLAHAPALAALGAPTANSYKRLLPGSWAPAHAAYAAGNRSALVRIPGTRRKRVEFRAGDNTSSPYLFLAGLLAAGLDGIARNLDPGAPAVGDLGHLTDADLAAQGIALLPRTAGDALAAAAADPVLAAALGPTALPEWLKVKRSELALAETTVSPWERGTYAPG